MDEAEERELIETILRPGTPWVERARTVRTLQQHGYALDRISGQTFVEVAELHQWLTALLVYESLEKAGADPAVRRAFAHGRVQELFLLRELPLGLRAEAARYALDQALDAAELRTVVQALLECRRSGEVEGFPCDVPHALAFRLWKQARGTPQPEERRALLNRALSLAADQAVRKRLQADLSAVPAAPRLVFFPVVEITPDRRWPRIVRYAGTLPQTSGEAPAAGGGPVPVRPEGPADSFAHGMRLPAGDWIALPDWMDQDGLQQPLAAYCAATDLLPLLPAGTSRQGNAWNSYLLVFDLAQREIRPNSLALIECEEQWQVGLAGPGGEWSVADRTTLTERAVPPQQVRVLGALFRAIRPAEPDEALPPPSDAADEDEE